MFSKCNICNNQKWKRNNTNVFKIQFIHANYEEYTHTHRTIDGINEAYIKIMAINILRAAAVAMVETLKDASMAIWYKLFMFYASHFESLPDWT